MERDSIEVGAWIQNMPEDCRVTFDTALKEGMTSLGCLRRAREELVALLEGRLQTDQLSHDLGVELKLIAAFIFHAVRRR
ncbi:MAG TPA: hypothetical protein VFM04_09200 [Candidatus Methylomirabilis sp.]|nr:hypothetical protein [Candidatus Methylomirabilis sp.]